jgi:hypothetical protein
VVTNRGVVSNEMMRAATAREGLAQQWRQMFVARGWQACQEGVMQLNEGVQRQRARQLGILLDKMAQALTELTELSVAAAEGDQQKRGALIESMTEFTRGAAPILKGEATRLKAARIVLPGE